MFIDFPKFTVITGKFSPFTENLLLPVNEIIYRTIITNFIACPPATSEAGASRPKSLAGAIFMVYPQKYKKLFYFSRLPKLAGLTHFNDLF
jgi:hypothetical protein